MFPCSLVFLYFCLFLVCFFVSDCLVWFLSLVLGLVFLFVFFPLFSLFFCFFVCVLLLFVFVFVTWLGFCLSVCFIFLFSFFSGCDVRLAGSWFPGQRSGLGLGVRAQSPGCWTAREFLGPGNINQHALYPRYPS